MQGNEPEVARSIGGAIDEQHRSIRAVLTNLEETDDVRRAIELLEELLRQMGPHFAEEERPGGMLDAILGAAYSQERAVEAIRREHVELAVEARATLAQAQECLRGPVAAVLRRATLLSSHIRTHERRESAAYIEALYAESGGSE